MNRIVPIRSDVRGRYTINNISYKHKTMHITIEEVPREPTPCGEIHLGEPQECLLRYEAIPLSETIYILGEECVVEWKELGSHNDQRGTLVTIYTYHKFDEELFEEIVEYQNDSNLNIIIEHNSDINPLYAIRNILPLYIRLGVSEEAGELYKLIDRCKSYNVSDEPYSIVRELTDQHFITIDNDMNARILRDIK